jgi:hypothetical protein
MPLANWPPETCGRHLSGASAPRRVAPGCQPRQTASLLEVQDTLANLILDPERIGAAVPPWLQAPPRGTIEERLRIYANAYPARVQEAIEETFPAVTHLIGYRETHALCARYTAALTDHSYNLNDVGAELPRFVRADELTARFPFLPDLAALEWEVKQAFDAFDRPPFDPASRAEWTLADWEGAILRFQLSVRVVASTWPIRELWALREAPIADIDIDLRNHPDHVLIHRSASVVCVESIDAGEAHALVLSLDGQPLGAVTAVLQAEAYEAEAVAGWLSAWVRKGLLVACDKG